MFSSNGASLQLFGSSTVFVHDPSTSAASEAPDETLLILSGAVKLSLAKARGVQSVTVRFVNRYDLATTQGLHISSGTLYEKTLTLHEEPQVMEGENNFQYSFFLPSNTAVYQRCRYGRVYGRLEATVKFSGRMTKDLTTHMPVHIIHVPASPGGLPQSLVYETQQFSEALGAHLVQAEAAHFTPSNLAHFQFTFLGPSAAVRIQHIEAYIKQSFEVRDPSKNGALLPTEVMWIRLFRLDASNKDQAMIIAPSESNISLKPSISAKPISSQPDAGPFAILEPHKEVAFRLLLRLPNDDSLRATTGPATDTPIRTSHDLCINIQYEAPGDAPRQISMSKDVTVVSCCCILASLVLPSYSADEPATQHILNQVKGRHSDCICGASLQQVMAEATDAGLDQVYAHEAGTGVDAAIGRAKAAA